MTEAKSRFSELISRAATGERFIIQLRERPVAALIGAGDLERLERTSRSLRNLVLAFGQDEAILEKVDRRDLHPAMAAFGLWQEEPELEKLAEEIASKRQDTPARPEIEL